MISDADLIGLARENSPQALGELWARHYPAAVRAAGHITNRFDPEDVASEAFTRILRAIRHGHGPTVQFRPYLYATLRAVSQNWHRDREHDLASFAFDIFDALAHLPDHSPGLDDVWAERLSVREAFDSLHPSWREVLWLTEVEGLRPGEAGEIMGSSRSAVIALHARARAGLVKAWNRMNGPEETADERTSRRIPEADATPAVARAWVPPPIRSSGVTLRSGI